MGSPINHFNLTVGLEMFAVCIDAMRLNKIVRQQRILRFRIPFTVRNSSLISAKIDFLVSATFCI